MFAPFLPSYKFASILCYFLPAKDSNRLDILTFRAMSQLEIYHLCCLVEPYSTDKVFFEKQESIRIIKFPNKN